MKTVLLSHDSGSAKGNKFVHDIFVSRFANEILNQMEDAAVIKTIENPVFTADSFTVKPAFFPGGDIGKLAVAGSCNDLAVRCAKPLYMSASFIIEEGYSIENLEKIADSMKKECEINDVIIVCGDTKILPRGSLDGIFINTSALGTLQKKHPGSSRLKEGMSVLISGPIGDHAAVILMKKKGLEFESELKSDCRSLWPDIKYLLEENIDVAAMRDITRGGLSGILHEWAKNSKKSIHIEEKNIRIRDEVAGFCELTGIDAYSLACEGAFILAVPSEEAKRTLSVMRKKESMKDAGLIGEVSASAEKPSVSLLTKMDVKRNLDMPSGEHLPRIC